MKSLTDDLRQYGVRGFLLLMILVLGGCVLLVASMAQVASNPGRLLYAWLGLGVLLAMTSSRHPIQLPGTHVSVSISEALIFLAVVCLGPYHGTLLAAFDTVLVSQRLKIRLTLYLFNVANITISLLAAGLCYESAGSFLSGFAIDTSWWRLLAFAFPLACLALIYYMIQSSVLALMARFKHDTPISKTIKGSLPWEPIAFLASAFAAGTVRYSAANHGVLTLVMVMALATPVPLIIYFAVRTYHDKLEEQHRHYQELKYINDSILEMLAIAIDAKDRTTHQHIRRVRHFACRMGKMLSLPQAELEALRAGALLHDIGKIGVPGYILNKPGKLTEQEFEKIKLHTIIGADILSNIRFTYPVIPIVRHHHERWDGHGYPDGLKGEQIPITARILALVDTYDAIHSDRPYHKAMSREEAKEYLRQNAGTYFDPSLVGLFVDHVETLEAEAAQIAAAHPGLVSHHMASAASSAEPAAGLARQPNQDRVAAALHTISTTNREVAALFEVSRTLGSSLSLQDMMAILANRLSKIVPFSTCGLAIFDSSRMEYEFVHAIGANGDRFLHRRGPITAGIVGWVIQNRKPMYNTSAVLDLAFLDAETGNRYRTAMVFPLLKDDWVLGAIALYSMETEAYTTEHAGLMETISKPISDALYKALAFEQAKAASLVDTSTGLASVGAFANQFEREFARCRRLGVSLSVVVVNTHTPAYGTDSTTDDWPAAALGRLILENVREIDIVSMYSGGCFAILLPESGSDETAEVLSRLKGVLGSASRTLGVTITLGSASYPMDGESMEDLLRAATLAPSSLATACAAYAGSSIQ